MKKRIRFLVVIALAVSLCVPIESALAGKVQIINNCKMGVYFELYNNASVGIWRRVSATTDYLDPNGVYTSSAECVMLVKFGYNRYEYQCTRECLWAKGRWDLVPNKFTWEQKCVDGCWWQGCGDATFEFYTDTNCNCANGRGMDYCSEKDKSNGYNCRDNDYFTCKVRVK